MASDRTGFSIQDGDEVYGSDGEKVGTVIAVEGHYVVVEKGWFFPTDYYIPVSAISTYEDGKLSLNVTKDVALEQGWDVAPTIEMSETTEPVTEVTTESMASTWPEPLDTGTTGLAASQTVADDTLEVPVYAEELTATTTTREVGGVRLENDVVSEEATLDVPVTEERVKVVRRTVNRPVDAADTDAFEEVILDVPLEVEEVQVGKEVRVAEEIVIQKEEVERTEHVTGTVRREEVTITEATEGAPVDEDGERRR